MKKNGFTLVEVLGVFFILSLLVLLISPNIASITKKSRRQLYDIQIKSIQESAIIFATDYLLKQATTEGETFTIELKLLKDLDIVKQDAKNPLTDNYFSDEMLITITNNKNKFSAQVYPQDSTTYQENIKYKNHFVVLKGNAISDETSTNIKENFIILNTDGNVYESIDYTVEKLNQEIIDEDYSKITYQINIDGYIYTITRQENCQTGICN